MAENKTYLCIDLKSFFASVECVERGLDPLCTNLVVADAALTEKTICLAVSPSLKKYGIGGRARLFEVVQMVKQANARRRFQAPKRLFEGSSSNAKELDLHPCGLLSLQILLVAHIREESNQDIILSGRGSGLLRMLIIMWHWVRKRQT